MRKRTDKAGKVILKQDGSPKLFAPYSINALSGPNRRNLGLFLFKSDSVNAHSAALHCNAHVVAVFRSTGNTQIYTNRVRLGKLNLDNAIAMIRYLEMEGDGQKVLEKAKNWKAEDWIRLKAEGEYPGAERWHYIFGMALNGSSTHAQQGTRLTPNEILMILLHAFHPGGVRKWWRQQGIDTSLVLSRADRPEQVSTEEAGQAADDDNVASDPGQMEFPSGPETANPPAGGPAGEPAPASPADSDKKRKKKPASQPKKPKTEKSEAAKAVAGESSMEQALNKAGVIPPDTGKTT
jgi:hypothetical protein